jgi:hypothetical protein
MEPTFPDVHVKLTGTDGNMFFIIGRVTAALKKAGKLQAVVDLYVEEVTSAGSYEEALQITMATVSVT